MSKYCTSCGAQLYDDDLFCAKCGAKQRTAAVLTEDEAEQIIEPAVSDEDTVPIMDAEEDEGLSSSGEAEDELTGSEPPKKRIPAETIIFIGVCAMLLLILFKACANEFKTPDAPPAAEQAKAETGKIGDYVVTIADYMVFSDSNDWSEILLVVYSFTNNSDISRSFRFTIEDTLFQNGVEIESLYSYRVIDTGAYDFKNVSLENQDKEIRPGVTLDVLCAYKLEDANADVEVVISRGTDELVYIIDPQKSIDGRIVDSPPFQTEPAQEKLPDEDAATESDREQQEQQSDNQNLAINNAIKAYLNYLGYSMSDVAYRGFHDMLGETFVMYRWKDFENYTSFVQLNPPHQIYDGYLTPDPENPGTYFGGECWPVWKDGMPL